MNMSSKKISTEECYVASIDLLGMKWIMCSDKEGKNLNSIRNIYKSWVKIFTEDYFKNIKVIEDKRVSSSHYLKSIFCSYFK